MVSKRLKQIVILTSEFPPQPGGIGNHAYLLARTLNLRSYDVCVICDTRSEDGTEEILFDSKNSFQIIRIKKTRARFFMYVRRYIELRRQSSKANVVIATGKFSLWVVALRSLFKNNFKTLAVIHGSEVNFRGLLKKTIDISLRKFERIIAVSNYTKSLIAHLNHHVDVIPNGIDFSEWSNQFLNNYSLEGSPKLITVGNVTERKGQLNVIRILPEIIKAYPNVHYHCIGLDTKVKDFMHEVRDLGVEGHVTFHGRVEQDNLKSALADSDIFVMLSKETQSGDTEGFGIAILEANALGLPAIGSKGCGIEDAIKDGCNGRLVNFNDSQEFLRAMNEISIEKESFSKRAISWARQHDWSKVIARYVRHF